MGEIVLQGFIAGLGTCLGAIMVISYGRLKRSTASLLLGLASGIMAAVVFFDLLPTSLEYGSLSTCITGFAAGIAIMFAADLILSLLTSSKRRGRSYIRMGYLIALGIAMHDLPEGLAIAAGFAAAERLGPVLALAIGLHNIPEGMATAAPLRLGGMGAGKVFLINAAISLITPAGTFLGILLIDTSKTFIGLLLAFAAGAMTYIVKRELLPESLRHSRPLACFGITGGALFILLLNIIV